MRAKAPSAIHVSQPVGTQDHVLGPATADVTLIEYGDFECPYSPDGTRIALILRERFGDRVQLVTEVCDISKRDDIERVVAECAKALGGRGQRRGTCLWAGGSDARTGTIRRRCDR